MARRARSDIASKTGFFLPVLANVREAKMILLTVNTWDLKPVFCMEWDENLMIIIR
jgi:hypothetical protein